MSMAIAVAVSTGMGYAVEHAGIDRIAAVVLAVLTFFFIAVPAVAGFGWSFRRAAEIDHLARRTRRAAAGRYIGPVRDKSLSVEADELARAIDELFRQHGGPAQGTPIDAGNHLIESARFSGGLRLPRFRLIPREESFYAQFTAMADQIRGGARGHAAKPTRLENEADRLHQRAVGQLFDEEHDPIAVMKWKEILDLLEDATDRTEDVANLLENIVVKHG